jgi:VanZ family protein
MNNRLRAWLPATAWLVFTIIFSSNEFSSGRTGAVFAWALGLLHIHLSPERFQLAHYVVRKCAHFSVYGILSGLCFHALHYSSRWRPRVPWRWTWAAGALVITLAAAASDEIHQAFVPSRTSSWHDVVMDMFGALFVQVVVALVKTRNVSDL